MKDKIILHVDANSFFASVECAENPALASVPVAVSGNPATRTGIILAKNEVAKSFGVKTAEAIWQARDKCPDLVCIAPNMPLYEKYSHALHKIFEKYTHLIESMGLDECWLDITETAHLFGGAEKVAEEIRATTKEKLGITVSVGISFCKLFAKLGSDLKKPDAQTIVSRENFQTLVYPLPIESIIGIGHQSAAKLRRMNVHTLGDLIEVPAYILKNKFGRPMAQLRKKLLGFDSSPVTSIYNPTPPKSVGNGTTTLVDIFTLSEIRETMLVLAEKISSRLRAHGFYAGGISVSFRTNTFKSFGKSSLIPTPTNSTKDILENAIEIVEKFWHFDEKIRAIRIACYNLSTNQTVQLSIFTPIAQKSEALNTALDEIRTKYGSSAIQPAKVLIQSLVRKL